MKWTVGVGVLLIANFAGTAMAACNGKGNDPMSKAQITALLAPGTNKYVCYNNGSSRESNETLLSGGLVQDYKSGLKTGKDPIKVVGSYAITGGETGLITYTYKGDSSPYTYHICTTHSGNRYTFDPVSSAGGNKIMVVTPGPGSC